MKTKILLNHFEYDDKNIEAWLYLGLLHIDGIKEYQTTKYYFNQANKNDPENYEHEHN